MEAKMSEKNQSNRAGMPGTDASDTSLTPAKLEGFIENSHRSIDRAISDMRAVARWESCPEGIGSVLRTLATSIQTAHKGIFDGADRNAPPLQP